MIDLKKILPAMEKLGKEGLFLTSGKKPNTMIISWGSVGVYFNESVFIAPVRVSRYTREMIDTSGVFSISVPSKEQLPSLKVFGAESGRDTDKYQKTGLKPVKCKSIQTSTIEDSALTIECEVIGEMEMDIDCVNDEIQNRWYKDEDYHIMYYGKIVNVY